MGQIWNSNDFFFGEEDFTKKMNDVVLPFINMNRREETFVSYDGTKIHVEYLINPIERAAIVISHGFCEFVGKYHEMMYYMYKCGYSVFFIDHRGHGYSDKKANDPDMVYVEDFEEYVADFAKFIDEIVKPNSTSKEYYLFAHSMGGAIGTMYLEQFPDTFKKAVLSSPMMEMKYGKYSMSTVRFMMGLAKLLHWQGKYMPGQHGFDNVNVFETSSAQSRSRYEYVFSLRQRDEHFRTYGGSYSWGMAGMEASSYIKKNADKVKIPVFLAQAGKDSMVQPEAQNVFAEQSGNTTLVRYEESKHEIFNACDDTRIRYYKDVFFFLESK